MKQSLILISLVLSNSMAIADVGGKMTTKDGIEKIKLNLVNSKANLEDYQKNMKIVEGNIAEVAKVRSAVDQQKTEISNVVKQNEVSMKTVDKQELEINKLIQQEEKETLAEENKVKDLEKAIAQLKANQEKRKANVTNYKEQLKQVALERSEWKSRHELLLKQQKDVLDRLAAVKKTEKDWQTKKKGYETEVSKWSKETDKHQKLHDQYTALSENKE